MIKIKSYKQTNLESCLPVCLLLLVNPKFSRKDELDLTIRTITDSKKSYAMGALNAFTKKYKIRTDVYVDNKYFLAVLQKELMKLKNKYINLIYQRIDQKSLNNITPPYILYVDHKDLGAYSHVPHFVIINEISNKNFKVFDPWVGKTKMVKEKVINRAVINLRDHIRFCPLLIKFNS